MAGEFFNSWALWEKMTFVLACAIVVAIGCGCIKLWIEHFRLRKYKKIAATNKGKAPEMAGVDKGKARCDEEECMVPFGIRAIESGIEVDGVWISRGNTPVGSTLGSSASSVVNEPITSNHSCAASSTDLTHIEMPRPAHPASSRPSSRALSASFESVEVTPSASRNSSPGRSAPRNGARQHSRPPASYTRYQNSAVLRNSATMEPFEGFSAEGEDARKDSDEAYPSKTSSGSSGKSSSDTEDSVESMVTAHSQRKDEIVTHQAGARRPVVHNGSKSVDLDLLQSHRMSHVAETGQLTPRVRRPGNSVDWAMLGDSNKSEASGYFTRGSTPSPPSTAMNPFSTPDNEPVTPPLESHLAPATPQIPLLSTYQPAGPHFGKESVIGTGAVIETGVEAPQPAATFQHQRDSQVLRKVNSGFEILRPGTFGPVPSTLELDLKELEAGERRQSRKLQKKRRPSNARSSSDVERI